LKAQRTVRDGFAFIVLGISGIRHAAAFLAVASALDDRRLPPPGHALFNLGSHMDLCLKLNRAAAR